MSGLHCEPWAAQDSSDLLSIVLQGGDLGLWDLDVASGRWKINDREATMLGYTRASADTEVKDWKSLVHADDLDTLARANRRHLDGHTKFSDSVHRLRHREGHYIWVHDRSVIVERDAFGKPTRIVGTHMDVTDRKSLDQVQERTTERLELALSGGGIGLWDRDMRTGTTVYNDQWWEIFGIPRDERNAADGMWQSIVHPDDYDHARLELMRHVRNEIPMYEGTVRARSRDGHSLWVTNRAKVVERDADGVALRIVGITMNVTRSKQTELALAEQQRRLRLITDSMPALIMHIDREERYTFVNEHFGRMFGIEAKWLLGKTLRAVNTEVVYETIAPHVRLALQGVPTSFEGIGPARDRTINYQSTYIPDVDANGAVAGFFAMTYDITERKRIEETLIENQQQLDALARVDSLTDLPNRRSIEEHSTSAIARSRRSRLPMALMYLDIDHFKRINDQYGHGGGDEILKAFAQRLRSSIRDTDCAARYAGDEFLVCLEGIVEAIHVEIVATKIIEAMKAPVMVDGHLVQISSSVGIAVHAGGAETFLELSKRADGALYEAKAAGRNCFRVAP